MPQNDEFCSLSEIYHSYATVHRSIDRSVPLAPSLLLLLLLLSCKRYVSTLASEVLAYARNVLYTGRVHGGR